MYKNFFIIEIEQYPIDFLFKCIGKEVGEWVIGSREEGFRMLDN